MAIWRGRGVGAALAIVALLITLAGGPGSGAPPGARADHVRVASWRLADIIVKDTDGRGARAGTVTVLESTINRQGGNVLMSTRWTEICNQAQRFRFRWQFTQDITRVAKGSTLTANLRLEADGGSNVCGGAYTDLTYMAVLGDGDGSGTPALEQAGITTGPNALFTSVGRSYERFYANPQHSFHVPGPRTLQVDTRFNMHRAYFKVDMTTRAGWFYEAVYLYEAEAGAPPPPSPSTGTAPPPTGTNPPPAAGGPASPGSIDLAGYCRSLGYPATGYFDGEWACRSSDLVNLVDLDEACQWQLGRADAVARQRDLNDPQSWACEADSAAALVPASPGGPTWTGTWQTDYGEMRLVQTGQAVMGTYDWKGGRVEGVAQGSRLTGTWAQEPTFQPPSDAGELELTLSADGTAFTGRWRYGSDGAWSAWNGTRPR